MLLSVSLVIILTIVTLDQVTKMLLMSVNCSIIPKLIYFTPRLNDGAAFSSLSGARVFFIIFTILSLVVMIYFLISKKWSDHPLFKSSVAVMIGGVVGNFIDRLLIGSVRDFILVWPLGFVCNVADIAITVACVMFIVYLFFYRDKEEKKKLSIKQNKNVMEDIALDEKSTGKGKV